MTQQEFEDILEKNKSYEFRNEKLEGRINFNDFQGFGSEIELDSIKFIGCEIDSLIFSFVNFNEIIFEDCLINEITLKHLRGKKLSFQGSTKLNKLLLNNSNSFNTMYLEADIVINDSSFAPSI